MSYKQKTFPVFIFLVLILLSSCSGVKEIAYLQNLSQKSDTVKNIIHDTGLYAARIKPKDMLSVTVVTSEPITTRMYNLLVPIVTENIEKNLMAQPGLQSYIVDNDGKIDFPTLGKIEVSGLNLKELENLLQKKLEASFSKEKPIITIRFINFSINILGEVTRPGKYFTTNERMTIFEALSLANDMTIYGRRDNVKVLRENARGEKTILIINLNDRNIIFSQAYYLEQNDVVYVEPNKTKSRATNFGAAETFSISAVSIVISLTTLLVNLLKK